MRICAESVFIPDTLCAVLAVIAATFNHFSEWLNTLAEISSAAVVFKADNLYSLFCFISKIAYHTLFFALGIKIKSADIFKHFAVISFIIFAEHLVAAADSKHNLARINSTFNFLISMIYSQLFNLLCDKADDVYGGKLPVHVRCLIDECANIGQIPQLEKLVATIRSREISACLVLQTRSQLKAIYKDNADTIVGNMDSQIFLGGSEPTTLKDLAEALGKETIDSYNNSDTRGNSPSYGTNYQKLGHELMSRDELAVLDGGKCILQLRGVRPFLSDKYDLTQHPNYKYTSDYDPKNALDIEKFLNRKEKIHPDDTFIMVDADSLPPA